MSDDHTLRESDAAALVRRVTLEKERGNPELAESLFRDALRAFEHASAPDDPALLGTFGALGTLFVDQGAFDEAEVVLTRALELSQNAAGACDDELPIVLRELCRLFILQSAYDRAEGPLLRLLDITKAQGDARPEVATVLASLASVRHAVGDYTSAAQRYREALRIRETTLTPNHITTAATMESLAETYAACGRFAEGIVLCNRALSIRETTLGANDASVRVARKRIADLQLEAQEESRVSTPPRSAPALQASPPVDQPLMERTPTVGALPLPMVLVPWENDLIAVWQEIESTSPVMVHDRAPWRNALATAIERRSTTAIAVAAGVVVVLAALGFETRLGSKPDPNAFVEAEPFNPAAQSGTQRAAAAALATLASSTPLDTLAIASRKTVVGTVSRPVASRATPPTAVTRELSRPEAILPSVRMAPSPERAQAIALAPSRADVVPAGREERAAAKPVADSVAARATAPTAGKTPEARGRGESGNASTFNAPISPTLIGAAPQPQFPEALRDQQIEGEVVVQFVVDETGRPDVSSMTVVRSPHVLLTNAVRAVLPQFRFEPARTAPPQSIPRPETVRYTFTFRAPRR